MFAKVPRKTVSVWRRIKSTVSAGLRFTVVEVPVEVVNLMDVIVTRNVRSEGLAGSVSATMVTATVPLPDPHAAPTQPTPPFGPLQAEAEKMANTRTEKNERDLLRFIVAPRARLVCVCLPGKQNALTPNSNVTREPWRMHAKRSWRVQVLNAVDQAR